MLLLVIALYFILGLLEITPLIKEGKKRDYIHYLLLFAPAFIMSLLLSIGVDFPKPEFIIQAIVEAIIGER